MLELEIIPLPETPEKESSKNPLIRSRSQATTRRVTPTNHQNDAVVTPPIVEKHLPNGDLYKGTFLGNVPHGVGKYLWSDGCMYEGEWKKGKANGKGKFSWPSGATYEGEFKGGRMEGQGTFTGSEGDTYKGTWISDKKHGYGEKRYANGDFYEGSWRRNLQDGNGKYIWKNGNQYHGEWKNGLICGKGLLIWANGNKFEGCWDNGIVKGNGTFTYPPPPPLPLPPSLPPSFVTTNLKKRVSMDGGVGVGGERILPRICIWESEGEAGDITCDIIDNVEAASMIYGDGFVRLDRQLAKSPCCFIKEAKKPGHTISKGHKNYDLMLNLQLGIR